MLQLRVDRRLDLEDTIPDGNVFNRGEGLKLILLLLRQPGVALPVVEESPGNL